jgi:hypothetical protein
MRPTALYVEQAGGLATIEDLQAHRDDHIHRKAFDIIMTYFEGEHVENAPPPQTAPYVESL